MDVEAGGEVEAVVDQEEEDEVPQAGVEEEEEVEEVVEEVEEEVGAGKPADFQEAAVDLVGGAVIKHQHQHYHHDGLFHATVSIYRLGFCKS